MKLLLIILTPLFLASCAAPKDSKSTLPVGSSRIQTDGGVDVGNMQALVPRTNVVLNYPSSWINDSDTRLTLTGKKGSTFKASRADFKEIASPTAQGVKSYLLSQNSGRKVELVNINGLEGVRIDKMKTENKVESELYLISELKDFIRIELNLETKEEVSVGEQILNSTRIKYRGVAYSNSVSKTILLGSEGGRAWGYSFALDCLLYQEEGCSGYGVGVDYRQRRNEFMIGLAGYDHGRIVELGPESQINYEDIRIEGDYLVAKGKSAPLEDIYTTFTPENLQAENDRMEIKAGYVYLVRTVSWPDEDVITKMRVDGFEGGQAKLTYQKLVYVDKSELQKQIDLINEYTRKYEQPLSSGEVVLYDRTHYRNYYHASFNFEFSTSGNMFITRNSWDVMFEGGKFGFPGSWADIGEVRDLGQKPLEFVSESDFRSPIEFKRDERAKVIVGHTYTIASFNYDTGPAVKRLGAFQVLEMAPNGEWVRVKFKRIVLSPAERMTEWNWVKVSNEISKVRIAARSQYSPLANIIKSGLDLTHISTPNWNEEVSSLSVDLRPFNSGFLKLPANISLEEVTAERLRLGAQQLESHIEDLKAGEVYGLVIENYFHKLIVVLRVENISKTAIDLSLKYLEVGYSPLANR